MADLNKRFHEDDFLLLTAIEKGNGAPVFTFQFDALFGPNAETGTKGRPYTNRLEDLFMTGFIKEEKGEWIPTPGAQGVLKTGYILTEPGEKLLKRYRAGQVKGVEKPKPAESGAKRVPAASA